MDQLKSISNTRFLNWSPICVTKGCFYLVAFLRIYNLDQMKEKIYCLYEILLSRQNIFFFKLTFHLNQIVKIVVRKLEFNKEPGIWNGLLVKNSQQFVWYVVFKFGDGNHDHHWNPMRNHTDVFSKMFLSSWKKMKKLLQFCDKI